MGPAADAATSKQLDKFIACYRQFFRQLALEPNYVDVEPKEASALLTNDEAIAVLLLLRPFLLLPLADGLGVRVVASSSGTSHCQSIVRVDLQARCFCIESHSKPELRRQRLTLHGALQLCLGDLAQPSAAQWPAASEVVELGCCGWSWRRRAASKKKVHPALSHTLHAPYRAVGSVTSRLVCLLQPAGTEAAAPSDGSSVQLWQLWCALCSLRALLESTEATGSSEAADALAEALCGAGAFVALLEVIALERRGAPHEEVGSGEDGAQDGASCSSRGCGNGDEPSDEPLDEPMDGWTLLERLGGGHPVGAHDDADRATRRGCGGVSAADRWEADSASYWAAMAALTPVDAMRPLEKGSGAFALGELGASEAEPATSGAASGAASGAVLGGTVPPVSSSIFEALAAHLIARIVMRCPERSLLELQELLLKVLAKAATGTPVHVPAVLRSLRLWRHCPSSREMPSSPELTTSLLERVMLAGGLSATLGLLSSASSSSSSSSASSSASSRRSEADSRAVALRALQVRCASISLIEIACALSPLRKRMPSPINALLDELHRAERHWPLHAPGVSSVSKAKGGLADDAYNAPDARQDARHTVHPDAHYSCGERLPSLQASAYRALAHFATDEASSRSQAPTSTLRRLASCMQACLQPLAHELRGRSHQADDSSDSRVADEARRDVISRDVISRVADEAHPAGCTTRVRVDSLPTGDSLKASAAHELSAWLRVCAGYLRVAGWLHTHAELRATLAPALHEVRLLLVGSPAVAAQPLLGRPLGTALLGEAERMRTTADFARVELATALLECSDALIGVSALQQTARDGAQLRALCVAPWLTMTALQWSHELAAHVLGSHHDLKLSSYRLPNALVDELASVLGNQSAAERAILRWKADVSSHLALCASLLSPRSPAAMTSSLSDHGAEGAAWVRHARGSTSIIVGALLQGLDRAQDSASVAQGGGANASGTAPWTAGTELALTAHLILCLDSDEACTALGASMASRLLAACFHRFLALFESAELLHREGILARPLSTRGDAAAADGLIATSIHEEETTAPNPAPSPAALRASAAAGATSAAEEVEAAAAPRCRSPEANAHEAFTPRSREELSLTLRLCTAYGHLLLTLSQHRSCWNLADSFTCLSVASTLTAELSLELHVEPTTQTPTHSVATSARQRVAEHETDDDDEEEEDGASENSDLELSPVPSPRRKGVDSSLPNLGVGSTIPNLGVGSNPTPSCASSLPSVPKLQLAFSASALGSEQAAAAPASATDPAPHSSSRRAHFPPDTAGASLPLPFPRNSPAAAAAPQRSGRLPRPLSVPSLQSFPPSRLSSSRLSMLSMPSPVPTLSMPSLSMPSLSLPSGRALSQTPTSLSFSNQPSSRPWLAAGVELTAAGYDAERRRRVLYTHPPLHVVMIQLILSLLLHPGDERLDASLLERVPDPTRSPGTELPLPLLLLSHLSHAANAPVLPPLVAAVRAMGDAPLLLLRLLAPSLFPSSRYRLGTALSRGSFGSVWSCGVEPRLEGAPPLAVKLIEVRRSRFRRSNLAEVFAEAYALWTLRGASFVTELYDVGTDGSSYWFVMRRYACTLADWANGHPAKLPTQEPQRLPTQRPAGIRRATLELLDACAHVLSAVQMLHDRGVHHYDLKLANVLCLERGEDYNGYNGGLSCIRSGSDGQVTKLALADFGVATCVTRAESSEPPARSRGTECIQSPEMLLVSKTVAPPSLEHALLAPCLLAPGPLAARGEEEGGSTTGAWVPVVTATRSRIAGERCDVWSLGCLFYELLAGESLFGTEPWSAFFHRLTDDSQPLLAPHKIERLPAPHAPAMCAFLSAVLQRQAERRPCLSEVCALFAELRATIAASDPADASSVALDDGPCASVATSPSPPPWVPPLSPDLERIGMLLVGAAQLSADLMLAPLRLLHATSSWHALGVGQLVSCGAQLTHKGEASRDPLSCVNLESGASLEAAVATVSRLMDRASARTTLIVFDDRDASGGYAIRLATALLERREGLSAFDARMRLRQVCPHMHE